MQIRKKVSTSNSPRVLVVGPGKATRGGMTSVIAAYAAMPQWRQYKCEWLETYDDRGKMANLRAGLVALFRAPALMRKTDLVHLHATAPTSFIRKAAFFFLA